MLRSSSVPVPLRVLALLIVVSALVLATLAPVLADQHPAANDGQRLEDQPADVQATYRAVYGADAEARWIADHNAALDAMMMAPMGDSMDPMSNMYYDRIVAVAIARGAGAMDMDLPHRIAVDVIGRGAEMAFLEGTDTGVVYGVGISEAQINAGPAPSAAPSAAPAASSGGGTPAPSSDTVTSWGDVNKTYLQGQKVELTLPSTSGATAYALINTGDTDPATLPAGLTFDLATRTIKGTPTAAGTTSMRYIAQSGPSNARVLMEEPWRLSLTIHVRAFDSVPAFRDLAVKDITIYDGQAIDNDTTGRAAALPTVLGGDTPVTYKLSGLPAGVSSTPADGSGPLTLTGTPSKVGTSTVTYTATDQDKQSDSLMFSITVEADTKPDKPSVSNISVVEGGKIGEFLPASSGGNGDLTYSISLPDTNLPTGVTFVASTRWLSGTVADITGLEEGEVQIFTVTYTVLDSYSKVTGQDADTVSTTFTITVTGKKDS